MSSFSTHIAVVSHYLSQTVGKARGISVNAFPYLFTTQTQRWVVSLYPDIRRNTQKNILVIHHFVDAWAVKQAWRSLGYRSWVFSHSPCGRGRRRWPGTAVFWCLSLTWDLWHYGEICFLPMTRKIVPSGDAAFCILGCFPYSLLTF